MRPTKDNNFIRLSAKTVTLRIRKTDMLFTQDRIHMDRSEYPVEHPAAAPMAATPQYQFPNIPKSNMMQYFKGVHRVWVR